MHNIHFPKTLESCDPQKVNEVFEMMQREIEELKQQNASLRAFIRQVLNDCPHITVLQDEFL